MLVEPLVLGTEWVQSAQGYLYQLDDHLDRFYTSAGKAALVPPFARPQLRRIILETAAASQRFDGIFLQLTCLPSAWPSFCGQSCPPCLLHPSHSKYMILHIERLMVLDSGEMNSLFGLQDLSGTGLGLDRAALASHPWSVLSRASTAWSTTTGISQIIQRYRCLPELAALNPPFLPATVHQH